MFAQTWNKYSVSYKTYLWIFINCINCIVTIVHIRWFYCDYFWRNIFRNRKVLLSVSEVSAYLLITPYKILDSHLVPISRAILRSCPEYQVMRPSLSRRYSASTWPDTSPLGVHNQYSCTYCLSRVEGLIHQYNSASTWLDSSPPVVVQNTGLYCLYRDFRFLKAA